MNLDNLSIEDITDISRAVYGEAAGADLDTMKMIARSIVNRLQSGRTKEFGGNLKRVLEKGYYAVKNKNQPYKQALTGSFNDDISKKKWLQAQQAVNDVINNKDYGDVMFYFTPNEIEKLKSSNGFNFDLVIPTGEVGNYKTFSYPQLTPKYRR